MDWKIFFSTFVLIFMAELGDKTQLATMGAAAGSRSPASVMLGAITALIVSSVAAVLVGMVFAKSLPERGLKIAAGIVFLVFAVLYLREGLAPSSRPVSSSGASSVKLFAAAHEFEVQEHQLFLDFARDAKSEPLKQVFLDIASEEAGHVERLKLHEAERGTNRSVRLKKSVRPELDACKGDIEDRALLQRALLHEQRMAVFYEALAEKAHIAGLRNTLELLAAEERNHAARLEQFRAEDTAGVL